MKKMRLIAVIGLVLIVQWAIASSLTLKGINLVKIPYRRAERAVVIKAFMDNPSPENKAAFQQELKLAAHHHGMEQLTDAGLVFLGMLSVEVIVLFYLGGKRDKEYKTAA